jgi:hypothetical protein
MPTQAHPAKILAILGALLLFGCGLWWWNRGYGKVSEEGYHYAMALMSACNRKDEARVRLIIEELNSAVDAKAHVARDAQVLLRIARRALDGKWESAAGAVRQLMKDQVRAAPQTWRFQSDSMAHYQTLSLKHGKVPLFRRTIECVPAYLLYY